MGYIIHLQTCLYMWTVTCIGIIYWLDLYKASELWCVSFYVDHWDCYSWHQIWVKLHQPLTKCIMKHQIRPHVNEHSLCHQCLGWHDDVIKWKHFLRYWPFMWGIHWSPVNFTHKGQWHEVLMFSLISAWINGWVNNHEAGDLRCHCAHHNIIVMNRDEFKNMYTVHSHWAATCYHWAVPFQVGTECIQQLSKSVKFSTHIWNW